MSIKPYYRANLVETTKGEKRLVREVNQFHHINVIVSLVLLSIGCIMYLALTADYVRAMLDVLYK